MWPDEDPYGTRKRLQFASRLIARLRPRRVLDVGCGTGAQLTAPLALAHPESGFVGVDADPGSIAFARGAWRAPNLEFGLAAELALEQGFDLVIASEVVEHVEDPRRFLAEQRARLVPDGRLLVTLPNGYGPFELAELLASVLRRVGVLPRPGHAAAARDGASTADTLADSPHLHFFSLRAVRALFSQVGFAVESFAPRSFLCGFLLDGVVRRLRAESWNARVADRLPAVLASDWMFVLRQAEPLLAAPYRAGWYARMRRNLQSAPAP